MDYIIHYNGNCQGEIIPMSLYIDESDCDILTGSGREPAICELRCASCGDGMRYDQRQCATCGEINPRYAVPVMLHRMNVSDTGEISFDPARPIAAKSIP